MHEGIDIGSESDGYRLTVGGDPGYAGGFGIGNAIDRYRLTVGGLLG